MERLLVVGGTGLLGSRIIELAKDRFEVFGTYNQHASKANNMYRLDAGERQSTFKLIEKLKPDCVIDTHSLTNLDYCETHPEEAWQVNVDGAKNIAEACKKFSCKYIFISTDNVFDGKRLKYTEKDRPHPLNYYARTKLIMEHILSSLDINYVAARTSVLYGTGGTGKVSFPIWLVGKLKNNEKVRIVTDQKNNPTLTDSLAEFLFKLYQKDETGVFHITGRDCISRYDFSKEIAKLFDLDGSLISPVTSPELNQMALRPGSVNMMNDKVEHATGMKTIGVKDGLSIFKKQVMQ